MNRRFLVATVLAAAAVTAGGERLRAEPFPLNRQYVAIALNGKPFDDRSRTLRLAQNPKRGYVMSAYAGCNYLSVLVEFADGGRLAPKRAGVTQMGCKDKIVSERVYFDSLLRMNRWRIESEKLILAGDKDALEFEPAVDSTAR